MSIMVSTSGRFFGLSGAPAPTSHNLYLQHKSRADSIRPYLFLLTAYTRTAKGSPYSYIVFSCFNSSNMSSFLASPSENAVAPPQAVPSFNA